MEGRTFQSLLLDPLHSRFKHVGPIMIEAATGMDEAAERVVLDETEEKQDGA